LHAYLTIPSSLDNRKLPMVLFVHGGPWARDYRGFDGYVQLLANRGYAVLQPNYRGSTGYGKKYLHAGDLQWGRAMQDDLTDAVKWAISEGIADPERIAIFGGSYGGYAALAGAAFTPDLYRCAVDLVGPSSLFTLLASFPPYWVPLVSLFKRRMGDPDKPSNRDMLTKASPLFSADRIRIPLLIAQGANDPRVTQVESEQIVAAIEQTAEPRSTGSIPMRVTGWSVLQTSSTSWREWKDSWPNIWADGTSRWRKNGCPVRQRLSGQLEADLLQPNLPDPSGRGRMATTRASKQGGAAAV